MPPPKIAAPDANWLDPERLGHENATLVLKTYGHLMPDSEDRTRRAIDTAWSTSNGPQTAQPPNR